MVPWRFRYSTGVQQLIAGIIGTMKFTRSFALALIVSLTTFGPMRGIAEESEDKVPLRSVKMRFDDARLMVSDAQYVAVTMLQPASRRPDAPQVRSSLALDQEALDTADFQVDTRHPLAPGRSVPRAPTKADNKGADREELTLDAPNPDYLKLAEESLIGKGGWLERDIRELERSTLESSMEAEDRPWNASRPLDALADPFERREGALADPFNHLERGPGGLPLSAPSRGGRWNEAPPDRGLR